jgi:polyisoprenoid-binding protein YceI
MTTSTPARRRWPWVALAAVAAAVVAGAAIWFLFLAGDAPPPVDLDDAAGGAASPAASIVASPAASSDAGASASPDATPAASPDASSAPADGLDGTWVVDTETGSFEDFSSTWAGFRVDEILGQGIGSTTAVGRTPGVTGSLDFAGSTLTAAAIEVDLTRIVSDRTRRDDAIQRSLETDTFPTATFVLAEPLDLGTVPAEGQTFTATARGDLTIHGVTRSVEFPLEGRLVGETVVVVGSIPVVFSDFGVSMPSAPIVVSVEDDGILEVQLFLVRG